LHDTKSIRRPDSKPDFSALTLNRISFKRFNSAKLQIVYQKAVSYVKEMEKSTKRIVLRRRNLVVDEGGFSPEILKMKGWQICYIPPLMPILQYALFPKLWPCA